MMMQKSICIGRFIYVFFALCLFVCGQLDVCLTLCLTLLKITLGNKKNPNMMHAEKW